MVGRPLGQRGQATPRQGRSDDIETDAFRHIQRCGFVEVAFGLGCQTQVGQNLGAVDQRVGVQGGEIGASGSRHGAVGELQGAVMLHGGVDERAGVSASPYHLRDDIVVRRGSTAEVTVILGFLVPALSAEQTGEKGRRGAQVALIATTLEYDRGVGNFRLGGGRLSSEKFDKAVKDLSDRDREPEAMLDEPLLALVPTRAGGREPAIHCLEDRKHPFDLGGGRHVILCLAQKAVAALDPVRHRPRPEHRGAGEICQQL